MTEGDAPREAGAAPPPSPPATGAGDLWRLVLAFLRAGLRGPRNVRPGPIFVAWLRAVRARHGSPDVILHFGLKKVLLVSGRDLSHHILEQPPAARGYVAGALKRKAMSFLAPHSLVIADGEQWERLRRYNERVLCTGRPHPDERAFLAEVHRAFSHPVATVADIRAAMGRVMLAVVFGDGVAPDHLARDIQVLFGLVNKPVKRALSGPRGRRRVAAFYREVQDAWRRSGEDGRPSLLARGRRLEGEGTEEELVQQIPHWMFTFTGSGAALLATGLALVASRPAIRARALREIEAAGPLEEPATIAQLRFLEACLLEGARLFPPVTRTFHRAPAGDAFRGVRIPPGMEILHYLPLLYRDPGVDASPDHFQPERWLPDPSEARPVYPSPFLSGARVCPGRDLILFVCKSALAILLQRQDLRLDGAVLASDPLPLSFPEKEIRFAPAGAWSPPGPSPENARSSP